MPSLAVGSHSSSEQTEVRMATDPNKDTLLFLGRLLERNARVRSILHDCFSSMKDIHRYPLLILLNREQERIVLLDIIQGNWDLEQTRACLQRHFNPSKISTEDVSRISSPS